MRIHPLQCDESSRERISKIFRERMETRGILPKNPWKAKRLETWLAGMGARFHPATSNVRLYKLEVDKFFNFSVTCPQPEGRQGRLGWKRSPRIRGRRETRYVHIEIPWALADKILMMGFLP